MKMSKKEKLLYPFYVLSHPFDGFYEIRHRGKGSVPVALLCLFLFGISYSLNRRYASFVVNLLNPRSIDIRTDVTAVFVVFLLFAAANWSITCLMEGEGRFRDILTVVSYSLLPMILTLIPTTVLSWFIAADEEAIYSIIQSIATLACIILILIGIMVVHNFSFGKTNVTLIFTVIALLIIIFIILLLISLVNQIQNFLRSVYTELILRT
jgi:hypothetical protein